MSDAAAAIPLPLPLPEPEKPSEPAVVAPGVEAPTTEPPTSEEPRPAGEMRILWDNVSREEWQALLEQAPRSTLEQTLPYGETMRWRRMLPPRLGVIEFGGDGVGLVQMQEVNTLGFHFSMIERGPLWFSADPPAVWWRSFLDLFSAETEPRFGRVRRFLPEIPANDINRRMIELAGFSPIAPHRTPRRFVSVDVTGDEAQRYRNLRADWRAMLVSSAKAKLRIEIETEAKSLGWLIARVARDKSAKAGASGSLGFVRALARAHFAQGTGLLLRAMKGDEPAAAVLIVRHGKGATYALGWDGKEVSGAFHLLMWRAMQHLEARGCTRLDLGGFTSKSPEDVIAFKRGMGGEVYELLPVFR